MQFMYSKYYIDKELGLIEGDVFNTFVPPDDEYFFDTQIGKNNTVDKLLIKR